MLLHRLGSFALVLCLAVPIAACGDDKDSSGSATRSSTSTTTATDEQATCSATGTDVQLEDVDGLPKPVEATRTAIFDAAVSCDFEALGAVALQNTEFGFSRDGEDDPIAFWRDNDADERTMDRLARIMAGPFVKRNEGYAAFGWPAVYQDAPTDEDYDALVDSGAYTRAEADGFQKARSYTGARVQIKPDGTWDLFFTGD